MADKYKKSIEVDVKLSPKANLEKEVKDYIEKVQNSAKSEIALDMDTSKIEKSFMNINKMVDDIKSKISNGMSISELDKAMKLDGNGFTKVMGDVTKITQSTTNGITKVLEQTKTGIATIISQMRTYGENGEILGEGTFKVSNDLEKFEKILEKIVKAKDELDKLSLVNKDEVESIKNVLNADPNLAGEKAINGAINKVKELKKEESELKKIQDQQAKDYANMESKQKNDSNKQAIEDAKEQNRILRENYELKQKQNADYAKMENKQRNDSEKQAIEEAKEYNRILEERYKLKRQQDKDYAEMENKQANDKNKQALADAKENNRILKEQYELKQKITQQQAKDYSDNQNKAYSEMASLRKEEYSILTKLINAQGQYKSQLEEELVANKLLQAEKSKQIDNDGLRSSEKEIELTNQLINLRTRLNEEKAKKVDKDNNTAEKEAQSLKKEDEEVDRLIQKNIRLLEIKKQSMERRYGMNFDTSEIDKAIEKLKSLNGIDLDSLKKEIDNINLNMREMEETARGAGSKIGSFLSNIGFNINVSDIFNAIKNSAKEAIDYVIKVEDAMIGLRRVYDLTDEQAKEFSNETHNMAMALSSSNKDTIETITTFKKLGYSIEESKKLMESTTKFNLAADINDMEKSTISIISTLKGFKLDSSYATQLGDQINKVSNDFAVTSDDIISSLKRSSAALSVAGNDVKQSISLSTVANEVVQDASKVGNALKTISARIQSVKDGAPKYKNLLKEMANVDLTDAQDQFRSTYDVLFDLGKVWDSLTKNQKAILGNELFGKQHLTTGYAILENYQKLDDIMKDMEGSAGSVDEEFNRYMDSTTAKLGVLKENIGGLFANIIDSDMTKGAVDSLNLLVSGASKITEIFGGIPTVISTVVGAMTLLNSKFKEQIGYYTNPYIQGFTTRLSALKTSLQATSVELNKKITATQKDISANTANGASVLGLQGKLLAYTAQLGLTKVGTIACTVATQALQAAMSMGLSLVITGLISGVTSLASGLFNLGGGMEDAKQKADSLSQSLNKVDTDKKDIDRYEELTKSLNEAGKSSKERQSIQNEIDSITQRLISSESQYANILNNGNLTLDERLEKVKMIQQAELNKQASDLDKSMMSQGKAENMSADLENLVNEYNRLEGIMNNTDGLSDRQINNLRESMNKLKTDILNNQSEIIKYNSNIKMMEQANYQTGRSEVVLGESSEEFSKKLAKQTEELQKNTDAKTKNGEVPMSTQSEINSDTDTEVNKGVEKAAAIAEATTNYSKCTEEVAKLTGYMERLNKAQSVTPTVAKQIAKAYPEIGDSIYSLGDTLDFLQNKINETQATQAEALEIMKGDDEEFYSQRIANSEEAQSAYNDLLNAFIADGEDAYNVDLGNYKTLNELKNATMQDLGVAVEQWLTDFVGVSCDGYANDFANFKSYAEAKMSILAKLSQEIAKVTQQMAGAQMASQLLVEEINNVKRYTGQDTSGGVMGFEGLQKDAYLNVQSTISSYEEQIKKLTGAYEKVDTSFGNFTGAVAGSFSPSGSIGSGGSGSGGKGKKGKSDAEKAAEKAAKMAEKINDLKSELDTDPFMDYNNAIQQIENSLSGLERVMDSMDSKSARKYVTDMIGLYDDEAKALGNLKWKQEEQAESLKNQLTQYGFAVDETGKLINSQERLKEIENTANSITGDTEEIYDQKKEYIDWIKDLQSKVKEYNDLVVKDIPETQSKFEELGNTIREKVLETINSLLEKQKELETLKLDALDEREKDDLTAEYYDVSQTQFEEYKANRIKLLKEEISKYKELRDGQHDEQTIHDVILAKQSQILSIENMRYENVHDLQQAYENIHDLKIEQFNKEIQALEEEEKLEQEVSDEKEKQEELDEKRLALKKAEIELERIRNQKNIRSYEKDSNGNWGFTYTFDRDAEKKAQENVEKAQKDLDDLKEKNAQEEVKKERDKKKEILQEQIKMEEELMNSRKDAYDRESEMLDKIQEQRRNQLEYYYNDMDELAESYMKDMSQKYQDNWAEINSITTNSLASIEEQFKNLSGIQASSIYGLDAVANATNIEDFRDFIKEKTKIIEDGNAVEYDYMSRRLENIGEFNKKAIEEKTGYEQSVLNITNDSNNAQLENLRQFSQKYTTFLESFLSLLQRVYDYRFTNIVSITKGSMDLVMEALVQCEEAYKKFAEMQENMGIDVSKVDINGVIKDFEDYKKSVENWNTNKQKYYTVGLDSKYIDMSLGSVSDALNKVATTSLGGASNINNDSRSINIERLEVNANNADEFIESLDNAIRIAKQKAGMSK